MTDTTSFLLVLLAAAVAPFVAAGANRLHPQLIVPIVVVELMLGAIIGPDILGAAEMNEVLSFLVVPVCAILGLEAVRKVLRRPAGDE